MACLDGNLADIIAAKPVNLLIINNEKCLSCVRHHNNLHAVYLNVSEPTDMAFAEFTLCARPCKCEYLHVCVRACLSACVMQWVRMYWLRGSDIVSTPSERLIRELNPE